MDPIATFSEALSQLPAPARTAVGTAVGKIIGGLAVQAGRKIGKVTLGDREERAVEQALKAAIASVVSTHEDLEVVGIVRYIADPPISTFITDLLEDPTTEVDPYALRHSIEAAGLDFEPVGVDSIELIEKIRRQLLRELRSRRETRELYGTVRLDQALAGIESLRRELRELRNDVSGRPMASVPTLPDWSAESLGGLLRNAREAMRDGQLDEAEVVLQRQLEEVRKARRTPAGGDLTDDPARRRHEQDLLLALAQLAVRRNQQRRALELVREAEGLGAIEGRSCYFAGWVLLNVGRPERALEILTPDDGSREWRDALAVGHLMIGDYDAFRALVDNPNEVENPDVLLALVRQYAESGELAKAEFFAERLARAADAGSVEIVRAIEAASSLVSHFALADSPDEIAVERWIESLRAWFPRAHVEVGEEYAFLRREVLWHEVNFHLMLLENDHATGAWRELAKTAPSDAAQFAALGPIGMASEEIEALLGAVGDPVLDGLLRARLSLLRSDVSGAATRFARLAVAETDPRRDHVLAVRLELEVDSGGDVEAAIAELDEISDPVTRGLLRSSLAASKEGGGPALEVIERALEERPRNLRLLRAAYLHAAGAVRAGGREGSAHRGRTLEFAEKLLDRLPCPEHRIMRVRALASAGCSEEALAEVRMVEASGYVTDDTVRLVAGLAAELRRLTERAAAARRLFEEFDRSDEVGLEAARSAIYAGDYGGARELLEQLRRSERREVAIAAYSMLAVVAEATAENPAAGREDAARILIEGYDQLGGPVELAGVMYIRALDTGFAREAAARIERDHGSFGALPGVLTVSIEQVIKIMRKDRDAASARAGTFLVGLLPFDRFAGISPRTTSYIWFAHRVFRVPHLIAPPRLLGAAREETRPSLPPLLLDRTALLLLAELDLVDAVLNSRLELLLERRDFDWLAEEEVEALANHQPGEHEQLRDLIRFVESTPNISIAEVDSSDESFWDTVDELGGGISGLEFAIAARDGLALLDDFEDESDPPAASVPPIRSPDVLHALTPEPVSYAQAERAREIAPSVFGKRRRATGVALDRPVLIGMATLRSWHAAGLLEPLTGVAPGLAVSPATREHLREQLEQQEAYGRAVEAMRLLRTRIYAAVEEKRIRLVGEPEEPEAEDDEFPGGGSRMERGSGATGPVGEAEENKDALAGALLTEPLARRYSAAADVGAALWSDDAATQLYLSPFGPLIPGISIAQRRAAELRASFPGLQVVGTTEVLRWLEEEGVLGREERLDLLGDLVRHGRLFFPDADLLQREIHRLADPGETDAAETLAAFARVPTNLPESAVMLFVSAVVQATARTLGLLAAREASTIATHQRGINMLREILGAWLSRSGGRKRIGARHFWQMLAIHVLEEPQKGAREMFRCLLDGAAADEATTRLLRITAWAALEQMLSFVDEDDVPILPLVSSLQALAEAVEDLQVDGRPVIPLEILRIALPVAGLDLHVDHMGEADVDGEHVSIIVSGEEAEREAAKLVEEAVRVRRDGGDHPPIGAAFWVPVQVDGQVVGTDRKVLVSTRVEIPRLLHRVSSDARADLLAALRQYYARRGEAELVTAVERLKPAFEAAGPEEAEQVRRELCRAFLRTPRTWAKWDLYRFFLALREVTLDELRAMVGSPPRWRAGEDLEVYLGRVRADSDDDGKVAWIRDAWGPFRAPVRQLAGFMNLAIPGIDEVRGLARQAILASNPYTRIYSVALLLHFLERDPDLRRALLLEPGEGEDEELGPWQGATLGEIAHALLLRRLRPEAPEAGLQKSGSEARNLREALDVFAAQYDALERVHAGVTRAVYRQVFAPEHDLAALADRERGDTALDPLGDLLLVGHLLVAQVFDLVIGTGRDADLISTEMEEVLAQHPLSEARSPILERMQPEQLGIQKGQANPYRITLLALLEWLLVCGPNGGSGEVGSDEQRDPPFWWTAEIEEVIKRISRDDQPTPLPIPGAEGSASEIADRFGVLFGQGEAEWARSILVCITGPGRESP